MIRHVPPRRPIRRGARLRRLAGLTILASSIAVGAGRADAGGECNPYYPLAAKARWVFLDSTSEATVKLRRTVTVESVQSSDGVTTAQLGQTVSGGAEAGTAVGAATTTARCTNGAIELVVKGSAGGGASNPAGTVTATLAGLPPADQLQTGFSWRSEGSIVTSQDGSTITTRVVRGSRVDGTFPVTVPAGTFAKALRILSVQTMTLRLSDGDHQSKQEIVEWYVRGLGLVKRETRIGASSDPVASAEELAEYSGVTPAP